MSYSATHEGYIAFFSEPKKKEKIIAILQGANLEGYFNDCVIELSSGSKREKYDDATIDEALNRVNAINPVKEGEIEFHGEDGAYWRYRFNDGEWMDESGQLDYAAISASRALDMLCACIAYGAIAKGKPPKDMLKELKPICCLTDKEIDDLEGLIEERDYPEEVARRDAGMNTLIEFVYRDGSNYKQFQKAVVKGYATKEDIDEIFSSLEDGERFVPEQVGLAAERFSEWTEDDMMWCELYEDGNFRPTKQTPMGLSIPELVENFRKAKGNWKPEEYAAGRESCGD